jgi:hypothetical protein
MPGEPGYLYDPSPKTPETTSNYATAGVAVDRPSRHADLHTGNTFLREGGDTIMQAPLLMYATFYDAFLQLRINTAE